MLIERRQWVVGAVAAVVLLAGIAFAVVTTGSTLLVRGDRIRAEFTDASGLKVGDFVFVSGVRAGSVTDVRQVPRSSDPDAAERGPIVEAEFALRTDARIPADTRAGIVLSSPLGKRGLALQPTDTSVAHLAAVGPLQRGDVIPVGHTTTLTDLPEFGQDTTQLLEGVDVEALRELTGALADVTQGQRQNVDRLFDGVQRVADILVQRRTQLGRALDSAQALVDIAASRDDQIVTIIDNFQVTLTTLLDKQDEVRRLLQTTAATATTTADLVTERRSQIDKVVGDLTTALDVVDNHQVDIAHSLPYLSASLEGFASITYADASKHDTGDWANVFVTGFGQVGIQALLGCGSPVDDAFTQLIGPDPNCDGARQRERPDPASSSADSAGALRTVFRSGLALEGRAGAPSGTQ